MKKQRLHKEISIAVMIKLLLIYLLYLAFFSHPPLSHLTGAGMANHLFSSPTQIHTSTP